MQFFGVGSIMTPRKVRKVIWRNRIPKLGGVGGYKYRLDIDICMYHYYIDTHTFFLYNRNIDIDQNTEKHESISKTTTFSSIRWDLQATGNR